MRRKPKTPGREAESKIGPSGSGSIQGHYALSLRASYRFSGYCPTDIMSEEICLVHLIIEILRSVNVGNVPFHTRPTPFPRFASVDSAMRLCVRSAATIDQKIHPSYIVIKKM